MRQSGFVVRVVEQHGHLTQLIGVEPPRIGISGAGKGAQRIGNGCELVTEGDTGSGSAERVFNHVRRSATIGDRYLFDTDHRL